MSGTAERRNGGRRVELPSQPPKRRIGMRVTIALVGLLQTMAIVAAIVACRS